MAVAAASSAFSMSASSMKRFLMRYSTWSSFVEPGVLPMVTNRVTAQAAMAVVR